MNYSEQYKEHIECAFAAFCNVVLRNAAFNAYRDIGRKQKHEISLEYLMEEKYYKPSTSDSYFVKQSKPTAYHVCGRTVIIENEQLGQAFSILSEQRKNVLILYFYCHYTDAKIGQIYGRSRSTANYWKLAALKQLRKELERLKHEQEADTL